MDAGPRSPSRATETHVRAVAPDISTEKVQYRPKLEMSETAQLQHHPLNYLPCKLALAASNNTLIVSRKSTGSLRLVGLHLT